MKTILVLLSLLASSPAFAKGTHRKAKAAKSTPAPRGTGFFPGAKALPNTTHQTERTRP